MATSKKTYAQLVDDLSTVFDRWGISSWTVVPVRQSSRSKFQTEAERTVQVSFAMWSPTLRRTQTHTLRWSRESTARENLAVLVRFLDAVRLAERRGDIGLYRLFFRQPEPASPPPPPPPTQTPIPEHYRVLGVQPDAPIEVVEAAWKALVKLHHPDRGGATPRMQAINAAMDQVRKERAQTRT